MYFYTARESIIARLMHLSMVCPGADPENFHGRWLIGWLPIVNHTGHQVQRGWLVNNGGHLLYYVA